MKITPILGLLLIAQISMAQQNALSSTNASKTNFSNTKPMIENPILKGFYPDPSICRVGEDYYLVTSSFEYFPGIPIFHSKDLAHWEQIGHILDRPSQLNLDSVRVSGGVYAPTIRYNKGTFYVINTLIGKGGNYYVTATNPAGPWSDPIFIGDSPGIDPSLFFDDNGKVYYTGNGRPDGIAIDSKKRHIWLQEMDLNAKKLVGEKKIILVEGALHDAQSAEAPHLYKKDGYYYLIIAEGGTGDNHSVTVFRSKDIAGPYEINRKNPILTHRNLGKTYPIAATGHADIVQTQNGEWWMVLLGIRPYGGFHYNLGRETFITPVQWEDGWPVVNPGEGKVLFHQPGANLPIFKAKTIAAKDNFDSDTLQYAWNFLRTPRNNFWSLKEHKGFLRMHLLPETITQLKSPSFIGRRQQDTSFEAACKMSFSPKTDNETAGLVLFMNNGFHFRFERILKNGKGQLVITKRHAGVETILFSMPSEAENMELGVFAKGQDYGFKIGDGAGHWKILLDKVDGRTLSRTNAGGFTGTYISLYTSSNGMPSNNYADFDWFNYEGR
jgi:alpha-N-arabinofuranosidase